MKQFALSMIVSLTVACGAFAAPAAPPAEAVLPEGFGVNIHFTDAKPGELEQLYAAGFRWVRMDFHWGAVERKKGEYNFSAFDRLVANLDAHHIRGYFIFDYSNPNYDDNLSPHSDEGRAAFARWAAASVRHFKGHGILWEMYNEPNIFFWKPKPNVEDYAKLAVAVGKAMEEAEPGEMYIGPASSTIDLDFLESCFKAGCLNYWSAVSVHPYRQKDPETVQAEYRKLRALIAQYAPAGRRIPIISGEWGYSSAWHDFDEARQAKYLPRELLTNLASDIPVSIWYDWHDDGVNPKDPEHHFGTVHHPLEGGRPDGLIYAPKPAYEAAKALSDNLSGWRFNKRLSTGDEADWVLLFENAQGAVKFAAWTSAAKAHDMTIAPGLKLTFDQVVNYVTPAPSEFLKLAAAWSRAPGEILAAGPGVVKVQTIVRNPLDHPITFRKITLRQDEPPTTLEPGKSAEVTFDFPITRADASTSVTAAISVDGIGVLSQRSNIVITNPLHVAMLPQASGVQRVLIENPMADGLIATAELSQTTGQLSPSVEIKMPVGQTQQIIEIPVPSGWPKDVAGLLMVGRPNDPVVLNLPPTRQVAVAGFSDLSKVDAEALSKLWRIHSEGDAKIAGQCDLDVAQPPTGPLFPGADSLRLRYHADKGWKFFCLGPASEVGREIPGQPAALGIWVYGNGKGATARLRFKDSAGVTWQPEGTFITWTGWRYIEMRLDASASHWGGKGAVDALTYPIHFDTLFLLDGAKKKTEGEVYVSTPTLVYEK